MLIRFFSIFFIIGLALSGGAFFAATVTQDFLNSSQQATGVVVNIDSHLSRSSEGVHTTMYSPVIKFKDSFGKTTTFKNNLSSSSNSYRIGDFVEVLYIPENPSKARVKSFMSLWFTSLVLGFIGGVCSLIGGTGLYFTIRKNRQRKWAKKYGTLVKVTLTDIFYDTSINYNGRSPWVLICIWTDFNGRSHEFRSDKTWSNPSSYIKEGDYINAKINPRKPKDYVWIDIDSLYGKAS
ncbi:MAG: DUF3592 domain-containing protein [Bdellovibrionales bacterium]